MVSRSVREMKTLLEALGGGQAGNTPGLIRGIDSWCGEVLALRNDSLWPGHGPRNSHGTLDDLFGAYVARDRLARVPDSADLLMVVAVDALFESFTEEVGRNWIAFNGMESDAGDGWWWARLPVSGPLRDDFDEALRAGHVEEPESDG